MQHYSGHFMDHPILYFYHTVLLWHLLCREFISYALLITKVSKLRVFKFSTMICAYFANASNFCTLFYLHFQTQSSKHIKSVRFFSNKINSSKSKKIINHHKNIFLSSNTLYLSWANQIYMNSSRDLEVAMCLTFLCVDLICFPNWHGLQTQLVIFSSFGIPQMSSELKNIERSLKLT